MKKHLLTGLVVGLLTILPPPMTLYANEIEIEIESHGRLEYNLDEKGDADVLLTYFDLSSISDKVTEYEQSVRKQWFNAFKSLGVNFDSDAESTLSAGVLDYTKLTVGNLTQGLIDIPRSHVYDGTHTNLTFANPSEQLQSVTTGASTFVMEIPKGWHERTSIINLTAIFREGQRQGTLQSLVQSGNVTFTHHVHNLEVTDDTGTSIDGKTVSKTGYSDSYETVPHLPHLTAGSGCFKTPKHHPHAHSGDDEEGTGCYQGSTYQTVRGKPCPETRYSSRIQDNGPDATYTGYRVYECVRCGNIRATEMHGPYDTDKLNRPCGFRVDTRVTVHRPNCGWEVGQCMYDTYTRSCPYYNKQIIEATVKYPVNTPPNITY